MFSSKKTATDTTATAPQGQPPAPPPTENDPAAAAAVGGNGTVAADEPQAGAIPGGEAPAAPNPLEGELAACKDRYARLLADFDNFRKRQVRDREEIVKRANETLILDLLPVLDHFELALAAAGEPDDPFVAGVRMVSDQLHAVLAKHEARPEDAAGQPFNPDRHEALSEMPSDSAAAGHVALQLRKGWSLAGRMIRPAQVMVSSGPAAPEPAPAGESTAN